MKSHLPSCSALRDQNVHQATAALSGSSCYRTWSNVQDQQEIMSRSGVWLLLLRPWIQWCGSSSSVGVHVSSSAPQVVFVLASTPASSTKHNILSSRIEYSVFSSSHESLRRHAQHCSMVGLGLGAPPQWFTWYHQVFLVFRVQTPSPGSGPTVCPSWFITSADGFSAVTPRSSSSKAHTSLDCTVHSTPICGASLLHPSLPGHHELQWMCYWHVLVYWSGGFHFYMWCLKEWHKDGDICTTSVNIMVYLHVTISLPWAVDTSYLSCRAVNH